MLDPAAVRSGRVRGRYFRENFAQGGLDLVQIVPELVTNADAAIAAAGRRQGRIEVAFAAADRAFQGRWRRELRTLGVPALTSWRWEVRATDDGEGLEAAAVDARLGALGVEPRRGGQRGLFGRGLRDVWLAQGAGRLESIRAGHIVETWFFPAPGDDPYAYAHVREDVATAADRAAIGVADSGTRVTVPLEVERLPPAWHLRSLVSQLVQLRPVLEDPTRELWLELPGELSAPVAFPHPEPCPERPLLFDSEVEVRPGIDAHVKVRRSAEPLTVGRMRATRRSGLVVRSGRAAHEATLAGFEGRLGARHLLGEVRCEAIDELQREALDSPRPQVVVRVDRSGLNDHHPFVRDLYAAIDRVLDPIVAAEERRASAHLLAPGRAIAARDREGLRALNDALKSAFEAPGAAGFEPGGQAVERPPVNGGRAAAPSEAAPTAPTEEPPPREPAALALRFKRSPIRLHPGEARSTSLLFDPERVDPGTPVALAADRGLWAKLRREEAPAPGRGGWARLQVDVRARVSVEPGERLSVVAAAGEHQAELEVLVVRHTATGWVREIARKDEDAAVEAEFDPETGTVTVYEGRPEFRALERAARRAGLGRRRVREYLPHRMLEVEVAANAVYAWAAREIVARRALDGWIGAASEYADAVRHEAQELRHRVHERLLRAFLDPAVFQGRVRVAEEESPASPRDDRQATLPL
ncbi:MAG: hypothetical protein H0U12_05950 [Thermoleophilaceae bacterium]|nr:hypothetical protein [Thermoleophilaceae bacterium]